MKVTPVRYTDDVPAMRAFLEALGLPPQLSSDSGGWVLQRGDGGGVQLHTTAVTERPHQPGDTDLSFESDEPLEEVQARLISAGFTDAHIIDEEFGRSLRLTDPDGRQIHVAEPMSDLYGYQAHDG